MSLFFNHDFTNLKPEDPNQNIKKVGVDNTLDIKPKASLFEYDFTNLKPQPPEPVVEPPKKTLSERFWQGKDYIDWYGETPMGAALQIFERPEGKAAQSVFRQFLGALPENVPIYGKALTAIRDNPQLAADIKAGDLVKNIPGATLEMVAGMVRNIPSYYFTFVGVGGGMAKMDPKKILSNPKEELAKLAGQEVRFNVPLLGEVTNVQARVADYVAYNPNASKLADYGTAAMFTGTELLNGLFLASLTRFVIDPRPVVVGEKSDVNIKQNPEINSSIQNHIDSARQVLKNTPQAKINQLGGTQELLSRTKINIVDQLNYQGFKTAANQISKIDVSKISTLDDFNNVINSTLSLPVFPGPQSFRLYQEPTITSPLYNKINPKFMDNFVQSGGKLSSRYDPSLETFFRMRPGSAGTIKGEIIQMKPSFVNSIFGKTKVGASNLSPQVAVPDSEVVILSTQNMGTGGLNESLKTGLRQFSPPAPVSPTNITPQTRLQSMFTPPKGRVSVTKDHGNTINIAGVTLTKESVEGSALPEAIADIQKVLPSRGTINKATPDQLVLIQGELEGLVEKLPGQLVQKLKMDEIDPKIIEQIEQGMVREIENLISLVNDKLTPTPKTPTIAVKDTPTPTVTTKLPKLDEYLKSTYGKTFDKATPKQRSEAIVKSGEPFYDPTGAWLNKIGSPARGVEDLSMKPELKYGGYDSGQFTDAYLLINDKKIAQNIIDGIAKKEAIVGAKKIVKAGGNYEEGIKIENKRIQDLKKSSSFPDTSALIPKPTDGKVAHLGGYYDLNGQLTAIISDGVNKIPVNVDKLAFMNKHLPKAEMRITSPTKPVSFVEGGKVKGLLMPIQPSSPDVLKGFVVPKVPVTKPKTPTATKTPKGDLASPAMGGKKNIRDVVENRTTEPVKEIQSVPENWRVSDEVRKLLKDLGITGVAERGIPKRYLGLYKPLSDKIRVQALFDIVTAAHEGIHGLDQQIGFTDKLIADTRRGAPIRRQLTDIYEALYPTGKRTHKLDKRMREGLAVLFENYFADPAGTTAQYPNLVNQFIKPDGLYYHPKFTELLDGMNKIVDDYAKLTPEQRIGSRIVSGDEVVQKDSGFSNYEKFIHTAFAKLEPVKRYAKKTGITETWDDPTIQGFNMLRNSTIVSNWWKGNTTPIIKPDGNWDFPKGSVSDWMKLVKDDPRTFYSYLISRRVLAEHNKLTQLKNDYALNKDPDIKEAIKQLSDVIQKDGFSLSEATAVVGKYGDKFKEAEKIYDDINNRLLDFAKNTGLKGEEVINKWKAEEGYVSFRRYVEDDLASNSLGTVSGSGTNQPSIFKNRTGSQLDILDPGRSQMLAINEIIGKGMENLLWNKVDKMMQSRPDLAARFEKMQVQVAVGADGRISYPQMGQSGIIHFYKDGKIQFRKAGEEMIAIAKTMQPHEFELVLSLLKLPAQTFARLTTTANPFWAASNFTIDQFTATAQTKKGFIPLYDPIKHSLVDWVKKLYTDETTMMDIYLELGGKRQTLASYLKMSPDNVFKKMTGETTYREKAVGVVDSVLNILEVPSNATEMATRYVEFKKAVESGESMSLAMYRASEITVPFEQSGTFGGKTGESIVKSNAYFNAQFQILYKFARAARDNPARMSAVFAAYMVLRLAAIAALIKLGSEQQKRLFGNQYARNLARNIYFPSPDGKNLIRFRSPEIFGGVGATVDLYAWSMYTKNPASFDDYYEASTAGIPRQFLLPIPREFKGAFVDWFPTALKPTMQTVFNTRSYPELAPIVPSYLLTEPKYKQYNDYTSATAKWLGQMTNSSPALVDFWIKNQFGPVGSAIATGDLPALPLTTSEERYVLSGRAINHFYDQKQVVEWQRKEMRSDPSKYSPQERGEIERNYQVNVRVADILSRARDINKEKSTEGLLPKSALPEPARQAIYELLIEIERNGTEDIQPYLRKANQELNKIK